MRDVVNPGTAAAERALGHFVQANAGDLGEQAARRGGDPLRVREVTRFLIGDGAVEPSETVAKADVVEQLADIADPRRKRNGTIVPGRVIGEEMTVLFERRAAAGGVDHVPICAALFERDDVAPGELATAIHLARVDGDRTAAALRRRRDDVTTRALQHANGCVVGLGEGHVHDAARVHECGSFPCAVRFPPLIARHEEVRGDRRLQRLDIGEMQRAQDAACAHERAQAGLLVHAHRRRQSAHQRHVGEEPTDRHRADQSRLPRRGSADGANDLRAGRLDEFAVCDTRRAHGFACPAIETLAHLMQKAGARQIEPVLADRLDERNPAARTRRLDERLHIGGTGGQTQAAPDALVVHVVGRDVASRESEVVRVGASPCGDVFPRCDRGVHLGSVVAATATAQRNAARALR